MSKARVVIAQELRIVDGSGRERFVAGTSVGDGDPYMNFFDSLGNVAASISLDPDGTPHIVLFSSGDTPRIAIGLSGQGGCGIDVVGKSGKARCSLVVSNDDVPEIAVFDGNGKCKWTTKLNAATANTDHANSPSPEQE